MRLHPARLLSCFKMQARYLMDVITRWWLLLKAQCKSEMACKDCTQHKCVPKASLTGTRLAACATMPEWE